MLQPAVNVMVKAARAGGHILLRHMARLDAIEVVNAAEVPLQDLLAEVVLYCSRMSNWVDAHIPWFPANELTKRCLGRTDLIF